MKGLNQVKESKLKVKVLTYDIPKRMLASLYGE